MLSIGDKVKLNFNVIVQKIKEDPKYLSFIGSKEYVDFINENKDIDLKIVNMEQRFIKDSDKSTIMYYVNKSFATVEEFGFLEDELIKVEENDQTKRS